MVRFKMIAKDLDSSPAQYRTWVVNDTPDYTASLYTGYKSGNLPLFAISAVELLDDNVVGSFSLPKGKTWSSSRKVLPFQANSSQAAVIDGYAYLFGGLSSNKILRSPLNNPTQFIDTGATLPTNLFKSQIVVTDGYVYLFGGNTGISKGFATDHIYSAPRSNPLNWTDLGALLPGPLFNSQLSIVDGTAYLFGGSDNIGVKNVIYTASVSNLLSWANSGTIPNAIQGSTLGIIGSKLYLFGGETNQIFVAPLSDLLSSWTINDLMLPAAISNSQFVRIGDKSFLIGGSPDGTKIYTCDNAKPTLWQVTDSLPGEVYNSQLIIVDDRLYLLGGNGSTAIFVSEMKYKYTATDPTAIAYGNATKTLVAANPAINLFKFIGSAPWKTDYKK